jgi:zinc protease
LFGLLAIVGCASLATRPAWELPPPPATEAPVVKPGALHRAELENGMGVLVLEDRRLPRVVLGLTFRHGEASLPPERAGLASFTAELLKRGAGERDALALAESIDEIGASLGASADWDSMSVGVTGLSVDLDRLFEILTEVVLRPRFESHEAERARGERLAALERAKDDPATLAGWHTARTLYPGHRFGLPLTGTPETVAKLDAAAARDFHARSFVPNDAILYASGDVDASDIIVRARRAFGAMAPASAPEPGPEPPAPAPAARRIVIVDRPDLVQARITVAHDGIARTDEDRIPTTIMNSVVGGSGFSSRLMTTLRSEEGLTYGVYSGYSLRRDKGPFFVSTFTRVSEVRRALDLLLSELDRGRDDPPGEDELEWARTLAIGRFSMGLETSAAVMDGLVDLDVYGLPRDSLDTFRSRVRAITPEQVAKAARDHLHPERAAIVLVGPAEQIRPQVEDLGPVEVVEP